MAPLCKWALISAVSLLLAPAISYAQTPAPTSATLDAGQILIQGSGFGSTNPMLFWDDVDSAYIADQATPGMQVPTSANHKWAADSRTWGSRFTYAQDAETLTGKPGAYYAGSGHQNYLGSPNHAKVPSLVHKIYVSWWYKPGMSPRAEGGSNKFVRIWDDGNGLGTRISWTQMHLTCENTVSWRDWDGKVGEWNRHEIWVDLSQQQVRTWVNGVAGHNANCPKTTAYPDKLLYVGLVGFDHGSEAYRSMTTAIDDIYVGASPARVEISEAATWSPTAKRQLLPVVSWSNNQIRVATHSGPLRLGSSSYIYVFDAQGNTHAEGIKINCAACPKPPAI